MTIRKPYVFFPSPTPVCERNGLTPHPSGPTPLLMQSDSHPVTHERWEGANTSELTSGCVADPTEARRSNTASMAPGWMMTASELWSDGVATWSAWSFLGG